MFRSATCRTRAAGLQPFGDIAWSKQAWLPLQCVHDGELMRQASGPVCKEPVRATAVLCHAAGLFRVRGFTQDDAHIFCLPEQIAGEIVGVLALVEEVMGAFGFKEFEARCWRSHSGADYTCLMHKLQGGCCDDGPGV